jgi:hypothetical protein
MAKSVRDLVASTMDPGDGGIPILQVFPPLDVEQIARELRLDERAETAGRAGQPQAQSDGPDMVELDILDHIERLARKAHEVYLSQIDHYEGRIRRAIITSDLRVQIEAAGSNALADIKAEIIHHQNTLNLLLQAVGNREEEFRRFRERHGLTRPPKNLSPDDRTLALLVLLVIVLLESILNGMFFAEGSEAGLIGGVVQALVLSILNVGVAALYALYGYPYLFHRRRALQAAGVLATVAFALWLIGLNLAIGHFRDLFVAGGGTVAMTELLDRLATDPLLLDDAKSLILVALGTGLGLLAVIDVASIRDRYPGYSSVAQDRQRAIERYIEENAKCLAHIMELRDGAVDDMTAAVQLIRDAQLGMLRAKEGRTRAHGMYLSYLNQLTGVHQRLVHRYRERNRRVRRGEAPVYFQQPAVRPLFAEPAGLAPLPGLEEDVRREVIARIDYYIKAVNDRMDYAMPEYQTVGQLGAIERAAT